MERPNIKNLKSKSFTLPPLKYYELHFKILSAILPAYLTKTEIKIMAQVYTLPKELTTPFLFNTVTRKRVQQALNMSSAALTNHISSMVDKKYLLRDEDEQVRINPLVAPHTPEQGFLIKMVLHE